MGSSAHAARGEEVQFRNTPLPIAFRRLGSALDRL
jgi:hypothetical protein